MTWWSPTKCHIQTVIIQKNSHGHGMLLIASIKYFHFALKSYLISKTIRYFFMYPSIWFELILPLTPVMELECKWHVVCISW
jgi:hypothetical protein